MSNPFDELKAQLDRVEALLLARLPTDSSPIAVAEIGSIDLAREVTRLSKARIYALVSAREIPHAKRGNKLYFNRTELLNWVAAGQRTA
jgi:excisionase family DNA binding protein